METAIDPRAIVIGSIVDNLATFALASLLLALATDSDRLLPALELAGLFSTIVGGFVAARVARTAQIRNGAGVGALALAVGLLSQVGPAVELPGWYTVSAFALVVPAGMMGGFLGLPRKHA